LTFVLLFPSRCSWAVSMSQDDASALNALVAEKMTEMVIANCCAVAATILLYYDYLLTLQDEIRCIWKRKFSFATVLFFVNRYVTLLYRTLMIVQMLPWANLPEDQADAICNGVLRFNEVLTIMLEITVATFMSLRMYAIWSSDRRIFAVVMLLGIVQPAVNIYYYTTLEIVAVPPPFTGCGENVLLSPSASTALSIFNRVFAIIDDAVILILTWVKTAGIIKHFSSLKIHTSLVTMLLRDGTVYFAFLLILNIANLVAIEEQAFGAIPAISDVVTSILISRFMLNLRGVYTTSDSDLTSSFHPSKFSDIRFVNTVVGNLGAPLNTSAPVDDAEAVEDESRSSKIHFSSNPLMAGLEPLKLVADGNMSISDGSLRSPAKMPPDYFDVKFDYRLSVIDIRADSGYSNV